jgi:hypothetical protein
MRDSRHLIRLSVKEIVRRPTPSSIKNVETCSVEARPLNKAGKLKASPTHKRGSFIRFVLSQSFA